MGFEYMNYIYNIPMQHVKICVHPVFKQKAFRISYGN